ncbi:PREDICTED: uncharacterized protein LOC104818394 isoform X2 [Tarenaya hassleriana]|uniref:uncharacterized protein LOC104818394 isoform X2 n=1 Tax=Tarenaya hassleriana TaxID=28532 RepID=UPI00053C3582|nr:PREDICTED: uncharacterized protein LOC104818394 isoform X2 [Tarenaya hassleriana]
MENGHEERLAERFSRVRLSDSSRSPDNDVKNDSLFQVIKAVEAAEATIKQQVEENSRLKSELQRKILELEKYKSDESVAQRSNLEDHSNTTTGGSYMVHQSIDHMKSTDNAPDAASSGMLVLHQHIHPNGEEATVSDHAEDHTERNMVNGSVRGALSGAGPSLLSSTSTVLFSPVRPHLEGDRDSDVNISTHGLMPVAEVNSSGNAWNQELIRKIKEQEQEIMQLRKYLADYSVKEAQIRNEKYILEKRISYMRLAFDQQQQDLVEAASKALSYRQEIIEENIRLTYALQAAQQERSTFVSYLLPLLSEYSLQPQVSDAQSIVSNVKVLFRHLQEKLLLTETKLKETEYQLAPWQSDMNHQHASPLSPSHPVGVGLARKDALDLVPRPQYSGDHPATGWDLERPHQDNLDGSHVRNYHPDHPGRYSPLESKSAAPEMPLQPDFNQDERHGPKQVEDSIHNRHVQFREPLSQAVMDDGDAEGQPDAKEASANWSLGNSSYVAGFDDPSSSNSPYLPPVMEEPSSSFSEDDDPLPAIEGLQISGEAYPGRELQACGYSINGTTSCNFEWERHLENGSFKYIDGANQPNYLVTADDVDTYLAIEVQPLDDRKRKGKVVRVFANENRKITCHPEMQSHIEKTLYTGHASYKVSLATGYLDIWEPATLSIKREGYNIKRSSGLTNTEKFSPSTTVAIPYGQPAEFVIIGTDGTEHILRVDDATTDLTCSRDTITLTLRLFIMRALEKRKGKKKGFLF